ncbi:ATP-dependent RNA helicase, putative [Leishmania tarentolae]|uniref:U5 small nuclear ribonucleoprotein 200 kDa helicase n=1 Tax=Leishmania tarentolae TaxID=5689 RepID=A0A640KHC2_LEITA|nr:ATP-dependent RNA helicase, putative [Leishmania tarentolae]
MQSSGPPGKPPWGGGRGPWSANNSGTNNVVVQPSFHDRGTRRGPSGKINTTTNKSVNSDSQPARQGHTHNSTVEQSSQSVNPIGSLADRKVPDAPARDVGNFYGKETPTASTRSQQGNRGHATASVGGDDGTGAVGTSAAIEATLKRLTGLLNRRLFDSKQQQGLLHQQNSMAQSSLAEDIFTGGVQTNSFVSECMETQRPVALLTHSGEPLSPRGDRIGGSGRSAYQAQRKISLDMLLSSVDDIVSQVYVSFDEDLTKVLLNALDRVTACDTLDQRERTKVRVIDELLEVLGDRHYDLLQCVMYRPREVFLRLLEEFCTLEDTGDATTNQSSSVPKGLTVRFVKNNQRSQGQDVVINDAGKLTDQRWLAHMNKRYRVLMQESELDELFKRDFSVTGSIMPAGATVTKKSGHVRIHIPPPRQEILPESKRVCVATSLPEWTHPAFSPITHLNTIQSTIFETAFHTSQNMLVCAPTGAGKTVCGLLVMLRCISEHFEGGVLDRDFKIIFVAPMKALAQEMVENFSRRLAPFMIKVRELTGDMQLTKRELAETQVIVTTPEKWDVITRKQSNEELVNQVRLIIMDEIHLLNEERGPVLEALVARTLRHGELNPEQRVRLVGLSATLPNYKDVANFLQADLREGLKVFGPEYRPVPLEQTFIGLQHTSGVPKRNKEFELDRLAYEEVVKNVREGHQVMVFVHSRKQTVGLAKYFIEESTRRGEEHLFQYKGVMPSAVGKKGCTLQGRDLASLFAAGFGAHHAGLVRYDRTCTESFFRDGYLRVLCCTSTLAWGVNLPAHTVVIRGTQMYDPKRGGLVSISVLDVMQIFGRAGRPQFDTSGHGIIISDDKEVSHFLRLIAHALPIESQMQGKLCDHLNAEVNAGTISSVMEASSWLEYTYMWQRIRVNPLTYGLKVNNVRKDPELKTVRYNMINTSFTDLAIAGMVRYNPETGSVESTDLGRLASHYYITYESISIFNEKMRRPDDTWIDALDMGTAMNIAASAKEFSQLKVRQEELDELQNLHQLLPTQVREYRVSGESADETSTQWKVTTLLKAYINRLSVETHSLSSDMVYVLQNMPRICRALFEIELERGHPLTTYTYLTLCKCIEHRCWDFEHPLMQFSNWSHRVNITDAVWVNLNKRNPSMQLLQEMTAKEVGEMVHNVRAGRDISDLVSKFPSVNIDIDVQPITRSILRVKVTIEADFVWSRDLSGNSEVFWLLVEDQDNHFIFHHESVTLTRKEVESGTPHVVNLAVPIVPQYDMYAVRLYSDRWMGCKEDYTFSIGHLHLPEDSQMTTKLLPLSPLRLHVIPEEYHAMYRNYRQFNAVQTQIFYTMFHTDQNVFLGAPTGSGKTIAAEMAILRVFEQYPSKKVVYIAPLKALVKERLRDWKARMALVGRSVVELSGDATPDISALAKADILCTTPEKWDGISRNWQVRGYVTAVTLVVFDEVHMLGTDRGPILEVIVSRMRYIGWNLKSPIRLVGLSTAVSNPGDLSSWLGVEKKWAVFNFDPSVRPVPMTVHIAGYHGKNYCPRMATMNKPTYNAICEKSPTQPVIVFVSSRRQTRLTAMALIGFLLMEGNTAKWVHMDVDQVQKYTSKLDDPYVKHCLQFGVGIHHAGLLEGDRTIVEEAFLSNRIQVLVATSTLAWGVNFPAHMVVVKGTEYYDAKTNSYVDFPITDVLQMIGRAGRPQFDTEGVAQVLCHEPKKGFYRKFLYDPFPVESALHKQLHVHINAEIVSGTINTRQDAVNYLTWTYLFRRIARNPSYYGLEDGSPKAVTIFLSTLVKGVLADLERCGCIEEPDAMDENADPDAIQYTVLGKLCSYYYISHITVDLFNRNIQPDQSCSELLRLLCDAEEFNELPVRHNEDRLNMELARQLPLPVRDAEADSPHAKAFLLFQALFERAPMPITDYITDQKSAMDNAVRVIQAMVDVAANNGHLYAALRCMTLMQCMVQARWWDDNSLLQIPNVVKAMLPVIEKECDGVRDAADLANRPLAVLQKFQEVLEMPVFGLRERDVNESMEAVRGLPLIQVDLTIKQQQPAAAEMDAEDEEPVVTYELSVHLQRLSFRQKSVIAPRFSKAKDEQYWVVVGHEPTGELVALKRVNRLQQSSTATLRIEWDEDWVQYSPDGNVELNVYLVCDSYIGMDQQYSFILPRSN